MRDEIQKYNLKQIPDLVKYFFPFYPVGSHEYSRCVAALSTDEFIEELKKHIKNYYEKRNTNRVD